MFLFWSCRREIHFSIGWEIEQVEKEKLNWTYKKKKIINQANSQGKRKMKEEKSHTESLALEECKVMFIVWFKIH